MKARCQMSADRLVALVATAWRSAPVVHDQHATGPIRKYAEFARFPKTKLPPLPDYARACADLIWQTFPGPSQHAVCERAARETGAGCVDTFARILGGATKHPDGYLMQCVQIIAASRGVAIPAALAIRVPS